MCRYFTQLIMVLLAVPVMYVCAIVTALANYKTVIKYTFEPFED